jgi:hypothetical protein
LITGPGGGETSTQAADAVCEMLTIESPINPALSILLLHMNAKMNVAVKAYRSLGTDQRP